MFFCVLFYSKIYVLYNCESKIQVRMSVGSKDRVETNGEMKGHTDATDF